MGVCALVDISEICCEKVGKCKNGSFLDIVYFLVKIDYSTVFYLFQIYSRMMNSHLASPKRKNVIPLFLISFYLLLISIFWFEREREKLCNLQYMFIYFFFL